MAQIVLEETAPGSTVYLQWRNVLHVVDIVCCCFILVPIVWSIRNLRDVRAPRRFFSCVLFFVCCRSWSSFSRVLKWGCFYSTVVPMLSSLLFSCRRELELSCTREVRGNGRNCLGDNQRSTIAHLVDVGSVASLC